MGAAALRRFGTPGWLVLVPVGVALAIGYGVARDPLMTAAACAAATVLAVGQASPRATAILGLLSLGVSVFAVFDVQESPEAAKAVVLVSMAPYVLRYGLTSRGIPVLGAYVLMVLITYTGSTLASGLTVTQILSSFVSLTTGWVLLTVNWQREDVPVLLKSMALTAVVSVGLGLLASAAGLRPWLSPYDEGPARLSGATIAPWLAMLGCMGMAAAIALWRTTDWRGAQPLIAVNLAIVLLTVTRGAILAAVMLLLPTLVQAARGPQGTSFTSKGLRVLALLIALGTVLALAVPPIVSRNEATAPTPSQAGPINTSGRLQAWGEFYDYAQVNLLFGRGLGSGPILEVSTPGFTAQHNEYLRMLLESGYVGGVILLAAIVATLIAVARRAPPVLRPHLWALLVSFAIFSFTDNTLSTFHWLVPFGMFLGLCAALGPENPAPARRRD